MKFKGRELEDWQKQVWDAKKKIREELKDCDFKEYLKNIRQGAEAFRSGMRQKA
ncbi:MAG: hypothetical protein JW849_11575 [Phycisphaerae bacterium]|nr:hypothetical protein [Phycisphaerae bacterium]